MVVVIVTYHTNYISAYEEAHVVVLHETCAYVLIHTVEELKFIIRVRNMFKCVCVRFQGPSTCLFDYTHKTMLCIVLYETTKTQKPKMLHDTSDCLVCTYVALLIMEKSEQYEPALPWNKKTHSL